jgi:hypothetical protein
MSWRLADGLLLVLGTAGSRLVELESGKEITIDNQVVEHLERFTLGAEPSSENSIEQRIVSSKVIRPQPPRPDPILRRVLEDLDRRYLDTRTLTGRVASAYEKLLSAHATRKRFLGLVGQCPTLVETSLRRALEVGDAAEVGAQRVLCVGDDDLVSIGLAALGHDVTVFDVDDYLLNFLRMVSESLGLHIEIREQDLCDPLTYQASKPFDVFLTDPMSNRDCIEIFVSRGLELLRVGGRCFTAVYPPASGLAQTIFDEMQLPVKAWKARHNRYYSHKIELHYYESDWVELQKTAQTRWPIARDATRVPLNLYREDYFQRDRSLLGLYENIENPEQSTSEFLLLLMRVVLDAAQLPSTDSVAYDAKDWTVVHTATAEGHITLRADRLLRQLQVDVFPYDPKLEHLLRQALLNAYKESAKRITVSIGRGLWDLRVV